MTAPDQDPRENSADAPAPAVTQCEDSGVLTPQRKCRYCDDPMSQNPAALVCKTCGGDQRHWVKYNYFQYVGIVISFCLLIFTISQSNYARLYRNAAEKTLQRVQGVESNISFIALSLVDFTLSENKKTALIWGDLEEDARKAKLSLVYDKAGVIMDQLRIPKSQRPAIMNEVESSLQRSPPP